MSSEITRIADPGPPIVKERQECLTCRFFNDADNDGFGDCHRFPPTVKFCADDVVNSFPYLHCGQWCGEWQPRIDAQGDSGRQAGKSSADDQQAAQATPGPLRG